MASMDGINKSNPTLYACFVPIYCWIETPSRSSQLVPVPATRKTARGDAGIIEAFLMPTKYPKDSHSGRKGGKVCKQGKDHI
eukprot:6174200-Pleurochrysis_carterae.AAC.2